MQPFPSACLRKSRHDEKKLKVNSLQVERVTATPTARQQSCMNMHALFPSNIFFTALAWNTAPIVHAVIDAVVEPILTFVPKTLVG
eukprot:gene10737-11925_t